MMVVKNSLAPGRPKARRWRRLFEGSSGTLAIVLGRRGHRQPGQGNHQAGQDDKEFAPFAARGGVMDGERLTADAGRAGQQVAQPRRSS